MHRYRQSVYPQLRINSALFLGTLAVAIWQLDFVIEGAISNLYLNGAIFGGIFIGVLLHYRNLLALKDEFIALEALYEVYDDARAGAAQSDQDAAEAYKAQRMARPAIVYNMPALLGSSFKLLYSQVQREGTLRIPSGAAKVLIEDLDNRVVDRQSMQNYVAGLMVLLGLLGTFIGLLATVGSVGDIIASIDLSGGAGPNAIQELLSKLEAPLAGMATGFSSSLFGLIGSLMLGMMTKVNARAESALKQDFENWINKVAQIELVGEIGATPTEDEPRLEAMGFNQLDAPQSMRVLLRVARATVLSNAQVNRRVEALCEGYDVLVKDSVASNRAQAAVAEKLDRALAAQTEVLRVVRDALERGEEPIRRLSDTLDRFEERLASEHRQTRRAYQDLSEALVAQSRETAASATAIRETLSSQIETLNQRWDSVLTRLRSTAPRAIGFDIVAAEHDALLQGLDELAKEVIGETLGPDIDAETPPRERPHHAPEPAASLRRARQPDARDLAAWRADVEAEASVRADIGRAAGAGAREGSQ